MPRRALYREGVLHYIGCEAGGITFGETFFVDGQVKYGTLLGLPVNGVILVRELVTIDDVEWASWTGGVDMDEWLQRDPVPDRSLVLTDTVTAMPLHNSSCGRTAG
jgi:hypothetical protein